MANTYWIEHGGETTSAVSVSNNRTGAIMETLVVATSSIAKTDHEKRIAAYLADRSDQSLHGSGCVGFALNAMPVGNGGFQKTKAFLLRAFDLAIAAPDWDSLGWKPDPERIEGQRLQLFQLKALTSEVLEEDLLPELSWESPAQYMLCPTHRAIRHSRGCIVCGDSDVDAKQD